VPVCTMLTFLFAYLSPPPPDIIISTFNAIDLSPNSPECICASGARPQNQSAFDCRRRSTTHRHNTGFTADATRRHLLQSFRSRGLPHHFHPRCVCNVNTAPDFLGGKTERIPVVTESTPVH